MAINGLEGERHLELKRSLHRIVAMLTRLILRLNVVAEPETSYDTAIEYETSTAMLSTSTKQKTSQKSGSHGHC